MTTQGLPGPTVYRADVEWVEHHTQGVCREVPATLDAYLRNYCPQVSIYMRGLPQ